MDAENQILERQLGYADKTEGEGILEGSSLVQFQEQNMEGENHTAELANQDHTCAGHGTIPNLNAQADCVFHKEMGSRTPSADNHATLQ